MAVIIFPKHHRRRCDPNCTGCWLCAGRVFCDRCGGVEFVCLPTDCPGRKMTLNEIEAVQDGVWDYRSGGWVHNQTGSPLGSFSEPAR